MPQRFLRPGIRTSPRWNSVSHVAARLYIAILTLVDDYGRYDGRPSVLWADAFAVWNDQNAKEQVTCSQVAAACEQLFSSQLLQSYEFESRKYIQVIQWQETARSKSKWPEPPAYNPPRVAINPPPPSSSVLDHRSSPSIIDHRQSGASRNGFQKPELVEIDLHCTKIGLPQAEGEKFMAYYESNGWKVGKNPMKDWRSAMVGWKVRWQEKQCQTPERNQIQEKLTAKLL